MSSWQRLEAWAWRLRSHTGIRPKDQNFDLAYTVLAPSVTLSRSHDIWFHGKDVVTCEPSIHLEPPDLEARSQTR
jgi:hypothetical protein